MATFERPNLSAQNVNAISAFLAIGLLAQRTREQALLGTEILDFGDDLLDGFLKCSRQAFTLTMAIFSTFG